MADGSLVSGVPYLSSAGFKERFAHLGFPLSLVAARTGDASSIEIQRAGLSIWG